MLDFNFFFKGKQFNLLYKKNFSIKSCPRRSLLFPPCIYLQDNNPLNIHYLVSKYKLLIHDFA